MPVKKPLFRLFLLTVYALATLQFVRYYVVSTTFYLDMPAYLAGRERLPFQERVLPIFLLWPINHSAFLMRHLSHPARGWDSPSAAAPSTLAFYLVALISFSLAGYLVVRLYRAVRPHGALVWLVFPTFTVLTLWTYVVHIDANFSYPYDMPSLAFFAGGLLAIYTRRFFPLVAVIFFGTLNRETTLFLVGVYILDAASRLSPEHLQLTPSALRLRDRFSFAQVSWVRVGALLAVWLAVKLAVHHHFEHNDRSEDYLRFGENLGRLRPRLWPILFNVCGYVLPIVVLLRHHLQPRRFSNYIYILPVWVAVMFCTGVILETRVYGELCTFTAVASVLLVEDHLRRVRGVDVDRPLSQHDAPDAASSSSAALDNRAA